MHRLALLLCAAFLAAGVQAAPVLMANITSLASNSEGVFVSALNVTNPSSGDAIALVIPANTTNYTATPPQKFKWANSQSPSYTSTGTGSVT